VPSCRRARVHAFVDALQLFEIGWSWGGVTSLAVPVNPPRTVATRREGVLVRFNVGLESPSDLVQDLEQGLAQLLA
jgi:cysteine-S-conjugate beta-lyase